MDVFTHPPTVTSLYDRWLIDSPDAALRLLKTYSLHPPDEASGSNRTKGKNNKNPDGTQATITHANGREIRLASMGGRKVARLHLKKQEAGQATGNEGGDTLYGEASYLDASPGVPVYWLPWDVAGAIIKLTIPVQGSRPGQADPDRFFTAAINGCSVFIGGTAQNPTVYHAGGDTGQNGPAAQAQFWRDLAARHDPNAIWEVNKEDYIKNQNVAIGTNQFSTVAAEHYKTWLENTRVATLQIEDVRPWACVMGIRVGGNWTFYLQENATVGYIVLRKKTRFLKKSMMVPEKETAAQGGQAGQAGLQVNRTRAVSRPLRVTEIFPNHALGAQLMLPIPRLLHG